MSEYILTRKDAREYLRRELESLPKMGVPFDGIVEMLAQWAVGHVEHAVAATRADCRREGSAP